MVLLSILILVLVFLTVFVVFAVSVGGAVFILIFADVIVCILAIAWLVRRLFRRRRP